MNNRRFIHRLFQRLRRRQWTQNQITKSQIQLLLASLVFSDIETTKAETYEQATVGFLSLEETLGVLVMVTATIIYCNDPYGSRNWADQFHNRMLAFMEKEKCPNISPR